MKTTILKFALAGAAVLALGACSSTKLLEGNQVVPSAQGEVKTTKEDFGNTRLTLSVKHLAAPEKVVEGATNYVVWIRPIGAADYQNIGALNVDKNLQGSYTTSIPHQAFKILVTPESAVAVQRPTGPAIFEDTVQ